MITIKLAIAIIAFLLSGGQIVFQSFQHHHAVTPRHGFIKFLVFMLSSLSLVYLAKDIYADFEDKEPVSIVTNSEKQAELDYWHDIYRHPTPEGYCAYLEKYPNGQFVDIAKPKNGDCLQLKREAEQELKKKAEAEAAALKEKLETETKALAEKNALLEKEAKDNAARIAALEQAKTAEELKAESEFNAEARLEAELKAKFELDSNAPPDTQLPPAELKVPTDIEIKTKSEVNESLF